MRPLICALNAPSVLLSGCATSTQSRVMLDAFVQDCNAGNPSFPEDVAGKTRGGRDERRGQPDTP